MTYNAACFDLDGTLIDTETIHIKAEDTCLARFGIPPDSPRRPRTFGLGIGPGMEKLARVFKLDSVLVLETYSTLWEKGLQSDLQLMPGASTVLSWLNSHNIPLALVTSSDAAYVDRVDSVLALKQSFNVIVTCDDTPHLKPDPMAYLKACKLLGKNAKACIGFEDSGAGVEALNNAGMLAVAVHPAHASRPELQAAQLKVKSLEKVETYLADWFG
jgi:HAD superfamily hydrolase (TIGR01509 family)